MALAYVLGNVFLFTATLPFARSSDGRCNNRTVVRNRVGQGWESGDASRSRGTRNRIYRPVRSLLACV